MLGSSGFNGAFEVMAYVTFVYRVEEDEGEVLDEQEHTGKALVQED